MRDAIVVALDERHRRDVVSRKEMTEVDVRAVVARVAERRLPHLRRRLLVAVIADHHAVLVGKGSKPLRVLDRDLAGDRARAERARQGEAIVQLGVRQRVDAVELHDLDAHTRVFVGPPEFLHAIHLLHRR